MKLEMNPKDQRPIKQEIRRLERQLKRLRERLKISDSNEVIALYDGDVDERIAVEADGLEELAWFALTATIRSIIPPATNASSATKTPPAARPTVWRKATSPT